MFKAPWFFNACIVVLLGLCGCYIAFSIPASKKKNRLGREGSTCWNHCWSGREGRIPQVALEGAFKMGQPCSNAVTQLVFNAAFKGCKPLS